VDQPQRVFHARLHSAGHLIDAAVANQKLDWKVHSIINNHESMFHRSLTITAHQLPFYLYYYLIMHREPKAITSGMART
jgi:hypothetical protein